jgi:putative addiction module component (TIGR02574 family)
VGGPSEARERNCHGILATIVDWTCFMPRPVPLPPPGFDDLSVDEKIDYLQSLWDRIAATPETIPVPDWHREILDERLKDLEADPDAGDSWEVVQERLRRKFDSRY